MTREPSRALRGRCRFPLRIKLVAVLIPLMAISMVVAMWGLSHFLREFFQRRAELETDRLGQAVQLALRQSMLRKPDQALTDTLEDVQQTPTIRRVWIIDKNGRIAHAGDPSMIGRVLDRRQEAVCQLCHGTAATAVPHTVFTHDERGAPILRHVRPIANEKQCWTCHDSQARLNGILLLEESSEPFQAAQATVQERLGATGGITILVLARITLVVSTLLIERPARRLITYVRRFGGGDLKARVPVRGHDELAELAGSFNEMAGDLDRSIEEIRNKNAELSVVYSILERLTKTIELSDLKGIILKALSDVFEADQVVMLSHLTQHEARETLIRSRGVNRLFCSSQNNDGAWELPEGFPAALADRWVQGELDTPFVSDEGRLSVIPVSLGERKLVLLLIKRNKPFIEAEANHKLLTALANHIGVAFENARLYNLAITDELTRLFSKRHFVTRIADAISSYEQSAIPFGLVMVDLDRFKAINDRYGHLAGDKVLRHTARTLLRSIRVGDSAYRYGGEEFAILLPGADFVIARAVAERIRLAIAGLKIHLGHGDSTMVTASAGVAACPEHGATAQELIEAADAALYKSKREGRNRISEPEDTLHRG